MNRTWTVSSDPEWIRRYVKIQISVKRAAFVSAWLHDHLQEEIAAGYRAFGKRQHGLNLDLACSALVSSNAAARWSATTGHN